MVERKLTKFPNLTKKHAMTMKIFNESGKGYWMEGVGCLRAEGENRPSRPGHIVIGCDLYNGALTWDVACNMNANSNASANHAECHGAIPVICFEPGIARREGNDNRFVMNKCCTLRTDMGDNQPAVCYAIEGNVVDRVSSKNGKGWCEDVSPTLNTQDRHAVVYALEGNGARPSHKGKGFSNDGTMYTLNTIEQHSVCYGISRSCLKGGDGSNGGMPIGEDVQPAMTANGCGAVAYAIENHPNDSRISIEDDGIGKLLQGLRASTGD